MSYISTKSEYRITIIPFDLKETCERAISWNLKKTHWHFRKGHIHTHTHIYIHFQSYLLLCTGVSILRTVSWKEILPKLSILWVPILRLHAFPGEIFTSQERIFVLLKIGWSWECSLISKQKSEWDLLEKHYINYSLWSLWNSFEREAEGCQRDLNLHTFLNKFISLVKY